MKNTRALLKKIASVPCLYRHEENLSYYGLKKQGGKKFTKALKSTAGVAITNFQEAKIALAEWLASLNKAAEPTLEQRFNGAGQFTVESMRDLIAQQPEAKDYVLKSHFNLTEQQARERGIDLSPLEKSPEEIQKEKLAAASSRTPTLRACFDLFKDFKAGNGEGTLKKYDSVRRAFELYKGNKLLDTPIGSITANTLMDFFIAFPSDKKPQYFNTFSLVVDQVFDMARLKGLIKANPLEMIPKNIKRRKVSMSRDLVPTIEQCEQITASIRSQSAADTREESANICELIHKAGLGQAEINFLTWADIDFKEEVIKVKRIKTGKHFEVPMYAFLKPFLQELAAKFPNRKPEQKLFTVQNIKKAIYAACVRLGLPSYSPRDLRKSRITYLLRMGYPVELIAEAQGHSDGGVLIRRVYSNVIDAAKAEYKKKHLAKLGISLPCKKPREPLAEGRKKSQ